MHPEQKQLLLFLGMTWLGCDKILDSNNKTVTETDLFLHPGKHITAEVKYDRESGHTIVLCHYGKMLSNVEVDTYSIDNDFAGQWKQSCDEKEIDIINKNIKEFIGKYQNAT